MLRYNIIIKKKIPDLILQRAPHRSVDETHRTQSARLLTLKSTTAVETNEGVDEEGRASHTKRTQTKLNGHSRNTMALMKKDGHRRNEDALMKKLLRGCRETNEGIDEEGRAPHTKRTQMKMNGHNRNTMALMKKGGHRRNKDALTKKVLRGRRKSQTEGKKEWC